MPAASLLSALPDNSTAPEDTPPQRETYDDITAAFGEGYNAPLSATAGRDHRLPIPGDTVNHLAKAISEVWTSWR